MLQPWTWTWSKPAGLWPREVLRALASSYFPVGWNTRTVHAWTRGRSISDGLAARLWQVAASPCSWRRAAATEQRCTLSPPQLRYCQRDHPTAEENSRPAKCQLDQTRVRSHSQDLQLGGGGCANPGKKISQSPWHAAGEFDTWSMRKKDDAVARRTDGRQTLSQSRDGCHERDGRRDKIMHRKTLLMGDDVAIQWLSQV